MRYDPNTGDVAVLQTHLAYANGIAISTPNASHCHIYGAVQAVVQVRKLLRHWIKGYKAETFEPFVDLPG